MNMKEIEIYKVVRNVKGQLYSAVVRKNKNNLYEMGYGNLIRPKFKQYSPNFYTYQTTIPFIQPLLAFDDFIKAKSFGNEQRNRGSNIIQPIIELWKAIAIESPIFLPDFHWWGNIGAMWPFGTILCSQIKLTEKVFQYH